VMLVLGGMLTSCASTGFRYHTLLVPDSGQQQAPAAVRLRLVSLRIPAEIDTQQLVLRSGASSVDIQTGDHWAAPLTDEVRAALEDTWRRQYGIENTRVNGADDVDVARVGVEIEKLDANQSGNVVMVADWWLALGDGRSEHRIECQSTLIRSGGAGVDGVVASDQWLVQDLAKDVASVVLQSNPSAPLTCPAKS